MSYSSSKCFSAYPPPTPCSFSRSHTEIFDGEYDGYLWPCVGFWVFDRFIRLVRIGLLNWRVLNPKDDQLKRNKATAAYDPEGDIIRLTVRPSINLAVGAGVHYYIYTPTLGVQTEDFGADTEGELPGYQ